MNIRAQFYLDLSVKLADIEEIKHFDLWNNQLEHLKEEEMFPFPTVFLEFMPIKWKSLGGLRQQAVVSFNLHIVSSVKIKSSRKSQTANLALQHLELIDTIHKTIQGWRGEYFGSINRTDSLQDHDHDDKWAHVETYQALMTDDGAVKVMTSIEEPEKKVIVNI